MYLSHFWACASCAMPASEVMLQSLHCGMCSLLLRSLSSLLRLWQTIPASSASFTAVPTHETFSQSIQRLLRLPEVKHRGMTSCYVALHGLDVSNNSRSS